WKLLDHFAGQYYGHELAIRRNSPANRNARNPDLVMPGTSATYIFTGTSALMTAKSRRRPSMTLVSLAAIKIGEDLAGLIQSPLAMTSA
ncbi:hypothetical protein PP320_21435, partial [Mycobacteroides abscessus]|nr:hypothetical protein [Mycobacteroides abscessus]